MEPGAFERHVSSEDVLEPGAAPKKNDDLNEDDWSEPEIQEWQELGLISFPEIDATSVSDVVDDAKSKAQSPVDKAISPKTATIVEPAEVITEPSKPSASLAPSRSAVSPSNSRPPAASLEPSRPAVSLEPTAHRINLMRPKSLPARIDGVQNAEVNMAHSMSIDGKPVKINPQAASMSLSRKVDMAHLAMSGSISRTREVKRQRESMKVKIDEIDFSVRMNEGTPTKLLAFTYVLSPTHFFV